MQQSTLIHDIQLDLQRYPQLKPKKPSPSTEYMLGYSKGDLAITDGSMLVTYENHQPLEPMVIGTAATITDKEHGGVKLSITKGTASVMDSFPLFKQLIPDLATTEQLTLLKLSKDAGKKGMLNMFLTEDKNIVYVNNDLLRNLFYFVFPKNTSNKQVTFHQPKGKPLAPIVVKYFDEVAGVIMPVQIANDGQAKDLIKLLTPSKEEIKQVA